MRNLVAGSRGGLAPARRVRPASRGATRVLSVMLLLAAALSAPGLAYAAPAGGGGGFHGGGGGGFHGGGGGGFHGGGGGFHGGGGGFHGGGIGGLHAGGFHAGRVRNSGFSGSGLAGGGFVGSNFAGGVRPEAPFGAGMDRFHAGSSREGPSGNSIVLRGGGNGGQWHRGWHDGRYGWWWGSDPYLWSNDDIYDDSYANGASDTSQSWYCSDPAGYYPSVSQCNTTWQAVSGN